ncbi:F0F1 ATP synthase subunit gamma [Acidiferrobacter sp.]|uniref:F0F1 ATP synthase subunit gamma n=1 Tax=Acidiferrobacter sp. TaxID=1872107 RepID=UPI002629EF2B|nr:F0F1 ATP synthase subunit gamma [Acidiferrobacter sp.]
MAQGKDIRNKIRSVQSTQKITRAMQMVAAAKMRKAQERMRATRPYVENLVGIMRHIRAAHPEYRHPLLAVRPVQRAALLVVTSDRGLAGALNANCLRTAVSLLREWEQAGIAGEVAVFGNKGAAYFRGLRATVAAQLAPVGDYPPLSSIAGVVKVVADAYRDQRLDRIVLVYNRFVNTLHQTAVVEDLLPLPEPGPDVDRHRWDYIYEPEARDVLSNLLARYVEARVYGAVVENLASEQAARMVAMRAATDNAGRMISDLKLAYNKARQAAITQEIAEIVGGASAV